VNLDKNKSTYFAVQVQYPQEYGDLINDMGAMAMEEFGCGGIEEFSLDEPRVDEILGERSYSGGDLPLSVIEEVEEVSLNSENQQFNYFFYGAEAQNQAHDFFEFLQLNFPQASSQLNELEEQDWNAEWKKHYAPIFINSKLEIVPSFFENYVSKSETQLIIEPGMGFGTGSHETTYLCLKLFTDYVYTINQNVLDFGSGSGILGLAACKLGQAKAVDLYDIDPEAMKNALVNQKLNELNHLDIRFLLPENKNQFKSNYNIVFANILLPVLKQERDSLIQLTSSQGYLILSGILNEQNQELIDYYIQSNQVNLIHQVSLNDWSAQIYQKK
jgi:ribosomal protein L11 methyltransferase